jgi:hypothetical protein
VQKEYDCNNDKMVEYLVEVRRLEKFFDDFEVRYVPRLETEPSEDTGFMVIDGTDQQSGCDWMSQIRSYLENRPLTNDNAEIERIARKSRMYHLIDGVLYRQGANGMMMRCISKGEDIQLLQDIHSGVCGAHSSW